MLLEELLRNLVSIDTANDLDNDNAYDYICSELGHRQLPGGSVIRAFTAEKIGGSLLLKNDAARICDKHGQSYVALCGHIDTVPPGSGWNTNPYELIIKDGAAYGLGACDMKGPIASMICTLLPLGNKKPAALVLCRSEETDHKGANELGESGKLANLRLVIGEPTSLAPVIVTKGYTAYKITVSGKAAHSSRPSEGANAAYAAGAVLAEIEKLNKNTSYIGGAPDSGPTISVGKVYGGEAVNVVCPKVVIKGDIRSNYPVQDMEARLKSILHDANGIEIKYERIFSDPPFKCQNPDLIERACKASGKAAEKASYVTDASIFAGYGIDSVILGPGNIDVCHKPNETIALEELRQARNIYFSMLGTIN